MLPDTTEKGPMPYITYDKRIHLVQTFISDSQNFLSSGRAALAPEDHESPIVMALLDIDDEHEAHAALFKPLASETRSLDMLYISLVR